MVGLCVDGGETDWLTRPSCTVERFSLKHVPLFKKRYDAREQRSRRAHLRRGVGKSESSAVSLNKCTIT